jgi:hypothetical protein
VQVEQAVRLDVEEVVCRWRSLQQRKVASKQDDRENDTASLRSGFDLDGLQTEDQGVNRRSDWRCGVLARHAAGVRAQWQTIAGRFLQARSSRLQA